MKSELCRKKPEFPLHISHSRRGYLYIWLKLCVWRSLYAGKRRVNFALAAKTSILQRQTQHSTLCSADVKGGNSRS